MGRNVLAGSRALAAIGMLLGATAVSAESDWHWQGNLYGWFPDLNGQVAFTDAGNGTDVTVPIETLLDKLQFTGQVSLFGSKERWGFGVDTVFMNLGDSQEQTRQLFFNGNPLPADVTARIDFDLKALIFTAVATYRLGDAGQGSDLYFGLRQLSIEAELGWQLSSNFVGIPELAAGAVSRDGEVLDAIIGIRGSPRFGAAQQWTVPYFLDMGTGDSDFSWHSMIGVGYKLGDGDLVLGWRHLDYDVEADVLRSINFDGPMLGYSFSW